MSKRSSLRRRPRRIVGWRAALQAGKHVYCEAPLAATLEDARQIARAALASRTQIFQAGWQGRANSLYRLTQIAKRNKGVFDAEKVYRSIDGREVVKPHGKTDKGQF